MNRKVFFILLFLVTLSIVKGLQPDERTYFDINQQKIVSQLASKIDNSEKNIQNYVQKEFEASTIFVEGSLVKVFKKGIKSLGFAMIGFILLSLSLFKVLDYKLNATKKVKMYEKYLQKQIKDNKEYSLKLNQYKNEMIMYFNNIAKGQNVQLPQYDKKTSLNPPIPHKVTAKKRNWFKIILIILAILIIVPVFISLLIRYVF